MQAEFVRESIEKIQILLAFDFILLKCLDIEMISCINLHFVFFFSKGSLFKEFNFLGFDQFVLSISSEHLYFFSSFMILSHLQSVRRRTGSRIQGDRIALLSLNLPSLYLCSYKSRLCALPCLSLIP
jgi:hypothetical protein